MSIGEKATAFFDCSIDLFGALAMNQDKNK
jgi:hypothetical protein